MGTGVQSDTREYMEIISNFVNIKCYKHRRLQTKYKLCIFNLKTTRALIFVYKPAPMYIYIEIKTQNNLSESTVSHNNMHADLFNKCHIMQIWFYSHVYMQYIIRGS
jgi:hypothetical protein